MADQIYVSFLCAWKPLEEEKENRAANEMETKTIAHVPICGFWGALFLGQTAESNLAACLSRLFPESSLEKSN